MTNIVGLRDKDIGSLIGEPDPKMVATIKLFLDMAERGELVGLAIATVNRDGFVDFAHNIRDNKYALLGAVGNLHHRLCDAINESPSCLEPPA